MPIIPKSKQELFGIVINDASAKSPPVDADCVALMDTASSNILKKLTLTGLKAFLKTYFDTLYSGAGGVPDGDKGDVTVSNGGTQWDIDPGAVTKADVGLSNADNTSDAAKPISTATQTALDSKSSTSHNHDGSYAALGHDHDATYEPKNANIQAHVASAHAPVDAQKNSDILQSEIEAKLTGEISTHSHAGGGGGSVYTEFTKDLGVSRRSGTFDITGLSGLTADKVVSIVQTAAPIASKGNARDEPEMDLIRATGYVVNTTTIRAYWQAQGVVVGIHAFAFQVSG